jgi:hypothetical protein
MSLTGQVIARVLRARRIPFTALEVSPAQVRRFREHDEDALRKQAAIKDDEERIFATAQASARQLVSLFETDSAGRA